MEMQFLFRWMPIAKLGPELVKGDPHKQSENEKILEGIIRRNALIVMNDSEDKCKGTITRSRVTQRVKEESVIDSVIVCDRMEDKISAIVIDEHRDHVLTRLSKTKKGVKIKEFDHNSIITQVKVDWNKTKNIQRLEIYNFKDIEGLLK